MPGISGAPGADAVVTVADSGIGIATEFLPFVFDRFRQADSSTSRAHGGLGIGLSIVRHLTEMHGGEVSVSSEGPGHGATFTVRLPVAEVAPVTAESDAFRSAPELRLQDLALLVVDDDPDSREVAARLLTTAGAQVTPVASVAEAVAVLERDPQVADAVLADIGMPIDDGYALVTRLRRAEDVRLRSLPVLAVTAYASRADRARALGPGLTATLPSQCAWTSLPRRC